MILLSSNMAAFCSFTVPLNQTLSWLYLCWRAVKGIAEVIFSSKFPAVPILPSMGARVEYPPSKPGLSPFPNSFPQPLHTHVALRLGFPKGLKLTGPTSFWWGGCAGKPRWEQEAEHCWAPGAQGSSQAQPGREQSLEDVLGCHLSSWGFIQSLTGLCYCLSVQEIQLW